jgi:hypothetical protein
MVSTVGGSLLCKGEKSGKGGGVQSRWPVADTLLVLVGSASIGVKTVGQKGRKRRWEKGESKREKM